MNNRFVRVTTVVLAVVSSALPSFAQGTSIVVTDTQIQGKTFFVATTPATVTTGTYKNPLPLGECTVAASPLKDSFILEANSAPLNAVIRAIAQQTNCSVIFSDEAEEQLRNQTIITYHPAEISVDDFFRNQAGSAFSWGKVGQKTYLVVVRQESAAEIAARKATQQSIIDRMLGQKVKPKDKPAEIPMGARIWLLSRTAQ